MPASAAQAPPVPASVRVPGAASLAIRAQLTAPRVSARILGSSHHASWLLVEDEVIVVSGRSATRLPNAVEVGTAQASELLPILEHGASGTVGMGAITLGGINVEAVRWWDPRPTLPRLRRRVLAIAVDDLPWAVAGLDSDDLTEAISTRAPDALIEATADLIGRGPGLTPVGDDYLAGALSGMRLFGPAVGDSGMVAALDTAGPRLSELAVERTTTFSASLIRHAIAGRVAAPAASFFLALSGRGTIAANHRALSLVGHTSGPALAAGIVVAARVLSGATSRSQGGRG